MHRGRSGVQALPLGLEPAALAAEVVGGLEEGDAVTGVAEAAERAEVSASSREMRKVEPIGNKFVGRVVGESVRLSALNSSDLIQWCQKLSQRQST